MNKFLRFIALMLCMALLSGCSLRTMDQLYCLPERSDSEKDLQAVIDEAMEDLSYSAPAYGENRQVTQKLDLDGDGVDECLVFAEDNSETPLKILIFCQLASGYMLMDTIEGYGFSFDFVEYAQIDGQPGLEIVVGRQVGSDAVRSVSVYRFASGRSRQLLNVSCVKSLVTEVDRSGRQALVLLSAGETEESSGLLSLYRMDGEQMTKTAGISLSRNAYEIQRMQLGKLLDGSSAVFLSADNPDGSTENAVLILDDTALYTLRSGDTVPSLGGYSIYPYDLDEDGVMELPSPIPMSAHPQQQRQQYFIQWSCLSSGGTFQDKLFTYMNYTQGWYICLEPDASDSLTVVTDHDSCSIYGLEDGQAPVRLLTVYALTGSDRETLVLQGPYTVLYKSESVIYAAVFEADAVRYGFTAKSLRENFYMLRTNRSTEES